MVDVPEDVFDGGLFDPEFAEIVSETFFVEMSLLGFVRLFHEREFTSAEFGVDEWAEVAREFAQGPGRFAFEIEGLGVQDVGCAQVEVVELCVFRLCCFEGQMAVDAWEGVVGIDFVAVTLCCVRFEGMFLRDFNVIVEDVAN